MDKMELYGKNRSGEGIVYQLLAEILEYPSDSVVGKACKCAELLGKDCPGAAKNLNSFIEQTRSESIGKLEEAYTSTFDLNPVCCLDVGYQLFGENFKRSEFMIRLKQYYRENDFTIGTELPDYLPTMLKFLGILDDEELKTTLLRDCIMPSLEKMEGSFKENKNYYGLVVKATRKLFESQLKEMRGVN